jgi:hypothetical protein
LSPIYGWKGLTVDALKSRVSGVRENLQDVNNMTEVYYPGLKRIHSEFDRIYEQKGKVPEVPSAGSEPSETKIATQADVEQTMKENNLSREETIKRLKAKGFQIQGSE